MANQTQPEPADNSMEKAVWGFVGTALTWIALVVSGVALERLGLVGSLLPESIVSGETGQLRADLKDCNSNLSSVTLERDVAKRTEDTLRQQISELKAAKP